MLAAENGGAAVRVSVSELAKIKGVTKQTISEKLHRLLSEGRIEVRRRGNAKMVSLAEWDAATNDTTDPARLVARQTVREITGGEGPSGEAHGNLPKGDPSYTDQLARKAGYEGDLKAIELARLRGELLPIDDVRQAMEACAEAVIRDIGQISTFADDVAAAVGKSGSAGAREILKKIERTIRETLSRSMTLLGSSDDEDQEEAA